MSDYPRKQSKGLSHIKVHSAIPKQREDLLKWNGWGYKDSRFVIKNQILTFQGTRYPIGGHELPYLRQFVMERFAVDVDQETTDDPIPSEESFPPSIVTPEVVKGLKNLGVSVSSAFVDRLLRCHGQTLSDMALLKLAKIERLPDVIVWPTCHEEVVKIVDFATLNDLVIIPFGGGTSVSGAVQCNPSEKRIIISLDTSQMNDILWVDPENLVVCCESGIVGQDLERELKKIGYTVGHEPDSYEFSSLGGWVATRASGMKKNTYGNIEDLLVHARMVTPKGILEKGCRAPRISCGPNFEHVILGSEGNYGVITEVVIKMRPLPKCTKYGSIVFPDFESGIHFMREVARQRCQPSSIRLMDNEQFHFGQGLRSHPTFFGDVMEFIKKAFLTKIKGFDWNQFSVVTLLFEGDPEDVVLHEKKIYNISKQFHGIQAGEKNGEKGYLLTFVIGYLRDLALEYGIVAESFETSVPWDRTIALCRNVRHRVFEECNRRKVQFYFSYRLTQTYDAGCCIYFYMGIRGDCDINTIHIYEEIEEKARDEIIASGGSISHHHGVGKIRKKWYKESVSELGVGIFNATKLQLDPKNIFGAGNLITQEPQSKL